MLRPGDPYLHIVAVAAAGRAAPHRTPHTDRIHSYPRPVARIGIRVGHVGAVVVVD